MSKKPTFTNEVRRSKIKQPTQLGFSEKGWKKDYEKNIPHQLKDEKLFESGLWFSKKLCEIRQRLKSISDLPSNISLLLRLYTGCVNREYAVTIKDMGVFQPKDRDFYVAGDLIEKKSPIGPGGTIVNPESVIEAIVSAIRYPLSDALNTKKLNNDQKLSDLELINLLGQTINLAILYDTYSDCWNECLWNDWSINQTPEYDNIYPAATQKYIAQIFSTHRVGSLIMESVWRAWTVWEKLPNSVKNEIGKRKIITKIIREKKRKKLIIGTMKSIESPPDSFIAEITAEQIYWNELLVEPLPDLKGITIREMLSIYRVLASLGKIIQETLPSDTGVKTLNKLLQYAPTFQRKDIEIAVKQATNLPNDKIRTIIEVFTFKGDPKTSTWFLPIIPFNKTQLLFLLPTLNVPNLIRTIEHWMKIGGIDLAKRGSLYENKFIDEISTHCKTSDIFKSSIIDNGIFKLGDSKEEIDFILILGNTVLVGEIKCSIYPASPIETFRFYQIIDGASKQAERKSSFLKNNLHEFASRYKEHKFKNIESINIIPVVVTNLHHGVGIPVNKIPVIDIYILQNYITGKQDFFAETSNDGSIKPHITKIYYTNTEEAEVNIEKYLKKPPLFDIYSKMIDKEFTPLAKISNSDKNNGITRCYINDSKWLTSHFSGKNEVRGLGSS